MKSKTCYLDFEFNQVTESPVNLVCCVTLDESTNEEMRWWLHGNPKAKVALKKYLENFNYFVSYSAIAECRSFLALGLMPTDYKWVDLFLEYRCITNHNDKLQWGEQLVDGKVKKVSKPRPKYERVEGEEQEAGFKATHSLAEATFKLLGVIRDTEHKNKMRDLIISNPDLFSPEESEAIVDYCAEDVRDLPALWDAVIKQYRKLDPELTVHTIKKFAYTKGEYSALTSIMEDRGYPFNYEKTKNFSNQVGNILYEVQHEINELFPDIKPFRWNRKEQRFSWDQGRTKAWIKENVSGWEKGWLKTDTKDISLSLEAWQRYFDYKHDYPKDIFGAQIVRFLKLKQSIYGFTANPDSKKRNFWDSVGKDKRVRPYFNIYGAGSSRSQPSATSFLFLKPAWMRALVEPSPGYAMAGIDYSSQEFLLSAILSGDETMYNAYCSGDVYLSFAITCGMVPEGGTKDEYKKERNLCKSTVLGLSYLMSKFGLANKLTLDSGEEWDKDAAQEMIDLFYTTYPELKKYQTGIIEQYAGDGYLRLEDGWYHWGDNDNFRSATNFTVQGVAAAIMRKAVKLAFERGLYVCITLHDALYIEYKVGNEQQIETLAWCMKQAFQDYFEDETMKKWASSIRLDPFAWGPSYEGKETIETNAMVIDCGALYIDDRAKSDYEKFKKYFDPRAEDLL